MVATMVEDRERDNAQQVIGDMAGMLNDTRPTMFLGGGILAGLSIGIALEAALAPSPLGHGTGSVAAVVLLICLIVSWLRAATLLVLAGRPGQPPPRTGADRTSVVLRIDNAPGALVAALTEFGIRDIDLTRIESRPTRTELGTYIFFLDCVGHIDDDAVAGALIRAVVHLRILRFAVDPSLTNYR